MSDFGARIGSNRFRLTVYFRTVPAGTPFESANEYSLDRLLPLRSVIEIEIADEEDMAAYAASSGTY